MLNFTAPVLLVYPWEAVIAEKFHAIVELGMDNSRMKDYFDLHQLTTTQSFDGKTIVRSIQAAFERRRTAIPRDIPVGLGPTFGGDPAKQTQWRAFLRKLRTADDTLLLIDVVADIRPFLMSPVESLLQKKPFALTWTPSGPWR